MIITKLVKLTSAFAFLGILSSCAWIFGTNKNNIRHTQLPHSPAITYPGGSGDNWRYIGTTTDGMLITEINNSSIFISKESSQIFNYEDRKTVVNPEMFIYPTGQPHFKFLVNNWQMDCQNKRYLIVNATMFDKLGTNLGAYNYNDNSSVKWLQFGDGSIAELEYKFICLNKNRNLGY